MIHKFLEALWKSQRQSVVQEFISQFCDTNVSSEDLDGLKALLQEIKVIHTRTYHTHARTHMHARTRICICNLRMCIHKFKLPVCMIFV